MTGRTTKVVLLALGAAIGACGSGAPPAKPAPKPPVTRAAPPPPPRAPVPEGSHYRAVDAPIRVVLPSTALPLTEDRLARIDGADARWSAVPEALRDRVRRNGFGVLAGDGKRTRLGEYYGALAGARVPFVVTMDAMVQIAHVAIDRLLADAEERTVRAALATLLARLGARLDAESAKVTGDLRPAYDAARGLVGVARAFASPSWAPPSDLILPLNAETRLADARAGVRESPVVGVPFDYAGLAPCGALAAGDAGFGAYRALAWLAQAPLMIASRVDVAGGDGDVYEARTRTRAALLVARLLSPQADAPAAQAWDAVARPLALMSGPPDDLAPRDLARIALAAGLDARAAEAIADVARIDKTRRASMTARRARVVDGPPGAQMRVLGASATPDAEVLQALVAPGVRTRAMPSALDVAAWLGAPDARALLRETERDLPPAYDTRLAELARHRPPEAERHGSVFGSGLEAIGVYVGASQADPVVPASASEAWRRRKTEVAIGAWVTLRHDAVPLSRLPSPASKASASASPRGPAVAFVEPHPEAIALLIASVEQAARGLAAIGAAPPPPPGAVAAIALDLLHACLDAALREANDEPFEPELAQRLADLPARLAELEARLAPSRGAERPLAIDVHADRGSARHLTEAIGAIDDLYVAVREPRTGRLVLAAGASIAAYEFAQPEAQRLTDDDWRARLASKPPPRAPWTSAYVVGTPAN